MRDYLILRNARGRGAYRGGTRGLETFGPSVPVIARERLTPAAAASLAAEDEVALVVPPMRTSLIEPLDSGASDVDGGWGFDATGASRTTLDGSPAKVAVLDTGIEASHPAFEGVQIEQRDFSGDGNGDQNGHGTHCAGTVLGRDVGQRIGVARGVTHLMVGKVLRNDGDGESGMIFEAMQWAISGGANIISISLGFDFPGMVAQLVDEGWPADLATSNALEAYRGNLRMFDAIMGMNRAQSAFGGEALVVAAAGNESRRDHNKDWRIAASLPAAASDVISVAAVGRSAGGLQVADFSNSFAVICGPGVDITSAWPGHGLSTISGTSMACPHVAGLAALWWHKIGSEGRRPTAANVRAALLRSATLDGLTGADLEADYGQGLATAP